MKTPDELESEYQLRRRNTPEESEESARMWIFKVACDEADAEIKDAAATVESIRGLARDIIGAAEQIIEDSNG